MYLHSQAEFDYYAKDIKCNDTKGAMEGRNTRRIRADSGDLQVLLKMDKIGGFSRRPIKPLHVRSK